LRIDVADNGPGLTDEERSRLFEPYFSRKKGGTGLGLTIVRSIISDHRGYVRALHNEGTGTVISMELPLA
jgi:two-component system nitrogen regulation sensor histidine kinase NtrY